MNDRVIRLLDRPVLELRLEVLQGLGREPEDDENGFVAARALGVPKARMLTALLLANGITDPAEAQRFFDER